MSGWDDDRDCKIVCVFPLKHSSVSIVDVFYMSNHQILRFISQPLREYEVEIGTKCHVSKHHIDHGDDLVGVVIINQIN